ncbi:hypothetical protein E4U19_007827 [Claviceps sp. Clav32 group G5]|nr:hypothetical protein E4U19_007827 [Claviceps sp. Clav32 group G5]KAG6039840.1 hypothetical protein E4U39_007516 [Claviceps sp. Clav50 group G5]
MAGALLSSQSFSGAAETVPPAVGNSRRFREEQDRIMAKVADQSFSPKKYHDPLIPRLGVGSHFLNQGITLQMETEWLVKLEAVKEPREQRS